MPSAQHLIAFAVTSLVIILVPGPSVLFIIGRALAGGAGRRS
jgi:threonine/homoserine/homoserine lactone efflux protein